jgi:hypothetical protein
MEGYVLANAVKPAHFIICSNCGYEFSSVWCSNCKTKGNFVRNINNRPRLWKCRLCLANHRLPKDFYENFKFLLPAEKLTEEIQQKIKLDKKNQWQKTRKELTVITAVALFLYLMFFPPSFLIHAIGSFFLIEDSSVRRIWYYIEGVFFLTNFLLPFVLPVWITNPWKGMVRTSKILLCILCIIPFFITESTVILLNLPLPWLNPFKAIWAVICVILLLIHPWIYKKWEQKLTRL